MYKYFFIKMKKENKYIFLYNIYTELIRILIPNKCLVRERCVRAIPHFFFLFREFGSTDTST